MEAFPVLVFPFPLAESRWLCLAGSPGTLESGPGLSLGVRTIPLLLRAAGVVAMAETAQLLMTAAATERDSRERLALWDRRPDTTAPLTDRQVDSVLELKAAAENLPVPPEVRRPMGTGWGVRV